MGRFLKFKKKFNLAYIFGEILLIFVGISLAIWFNNWNSSSEVEQNKDVALERITEEIKYNLGELKIANDNYHFLSNAYKSYRPLYDINSNIVVTTSAHLKSLKDSFPGFFILKDSVEQIGDTIKYTGSTYFNLELPDLTEIAWDTSKSIGITNELNYDCLYEMESMYLLQRRVQNEVNKASDALQAGEIIKLMEVLAFLKQFASDLEDHYSEVLAVINTCGTK